MIAKCEYCGRFLMKTEVRLCEYCRDYWGDRKMTKKSIEKLDKDLHEISRRGYDHEQ